MPEICRFYGIVVRLYFDDHPPPHFHAYYGEHEALVDIRTRSILAGGLPARALGMVVEWATLRQAEILEAWEKARAAQPPGKVRPLD